MNLKQQMRLSLQSERDKQLWTDADMWKAGFIGSLVGIIIAALWMI